MARHIVPEWLNTADWVGETTPATQAMHDTILQQFGPGIGPTAKALFSESRFNAPPGHDRAKYALLSARSRLPRNGDELRGVGPHGSYNYSSDPEVQAVLKAQAEGKYLNDPLKDAKTLTAYCPHLPKAIMRSALHLEPGSLEAKGRFTSPAKIPAIVKALQVEPIRDQILEDLCFTEISNLFRCSKDVAKALDTYFTLWDFSMRNFLGASHTEEELRILQEAEKVPKSWSARGARTLMISETTGPWDNQAQRRLEMSLMNLSCSSLRMWRAVMLQGNTIQRLALVNVSFLDLKGVAAMVNACPKLSTLEVARCEQVRHSMLAPFLRQCIIPTQKQRGSEIHCDISPHFERGSPYKNFIATDSNHVRSVFRQGTFGVTYNDSGIKIPVAVAGWLIYHDTLDAIYDAGQMHMLSYDAVFRQWLESIPAPEFFIPRVLSLWRSKREYGTKMTATEDAFLNDWYTENLFSNDAYPGFSYATWTPEFRQWEAEKRVWFNYALASTVFGEERWAETKDRSAVRSGDFQCKQINYHRWAAPWGCRVCRLKMPRMMFTTGYVCQACLLKRYIFEEENDHLKPQKLRVTEAMGFGDVWTDVFKSLAESNIPPLSFLTDVGEDGQVNSRLGDGTEDDIDLMRIFPALQSFNDEVRRLNNLERNSANLPVTERRFTYVQTANELGEYETYNRNVWDAVRYSAYRRSQSVDEFAQKCESPRLGWTPEDGRKLYGDW